MEQDYVIKLCNDLCNVINNNPMPISIKYYIIKDIFNEVQMAFNQYREEVTKVTQEQISDEKKETKEVTIPVKYTNEEIEAMKKNQ